MQIKSIVSYLLPVVLGLFAVGFRANATFPGENGKIVFVANLSGTWQIYTINPDGTDMKQITNLPSTNFEFWTPTFSPDGKRIAFSHDMTGAPEVYVMNADGSGLTQLTSGGHNSPFPYPRWSLDGTRIAFEPDSSLTPALGVQATMRADGSDIVPLTKGIWDSGAGTYTSDGSRMVFYSQRGGLLSAVWIMNIDSSGKQRLTDASFGGFPDDISPDSKRILLNDHGNSNFGTNIFSMNLDGTDVRQLTDRGDIGCTYSPDGQKIVFISGRLTPGSLDLFTMNTDGSDIRRIAGGLTVGGCPDGNCVGPSWGPRP